MSVKLSRTKQDFWKLNNDEQVAELTQRMINLQKDYKKFCELLRQKYFIDHYQNVNEDLKSFYNIQPLNRTIESGNIVFTELIPHMGRYSK